MSDSRKVAVITGASQGIGAGLVDAFLAKGFRVVATSRSIKDNGNPDVLVVPGDRLVTTGPYKFISHPNYVAVVGEIISVAMTVWAPITGTLAVIGFGWLMILRVRVEERALGKPVRRSAERGGG